MKILALDLSMRNSGYALYIDSKLDTYGVIPEPKYKGKSTERYPQRTAKVGIMMADSVLELIKDIKPDLIVIEEISIGGRQGIKSIKGIVQLHGMILDRIYTLDLDLLNNTVFISPGGKDGWRPVLGLKKNGDWKASAVLLANSTFNLILDLKDHDIADAILIGEGYIQLTS